MARDLTENIALVTGSAHRVGKAIALQLARAGVSIMVHYNRTDADIVRDTVHEIKSFGVDAFDVQADISQAEGVQAVMNAVREKFGKLDVLVNSASVFQQRHLMDVTLEDWDLTFNVNVRAPFLFTQAAARLMQENDPPGGVIVNIADAGADGPWPKYPHHGVSKGALKLLSEVSALALAPQIRVNTVIPGPVLKTNRPMSEEAWAKEGERLPLKRTGAPEDVARAVLYLVGEDFLTGATLHVNGGEHLA